MLPQNKRSYAFMWEQQMRFSAVAQAAIRAHIPETVRLEKVDPWQLAAEQREWVLKSDYGCEGEEVILGAGCSVEDWQASLQHALPRRWVAQRYFPAARESSSGDAPAIDASPTTGSI